MYQRLIYIQRLLRSNARYHAWSTQLFQHFGSAQALSHTLCTRQRNGHSTMGSVCDDLTGERDAAEFWDRAFGAYPQLKDTKLNAIATAFTCAGYLIMEDLYTLDEADMQAVLEAAKEPVKFSDMLIRLMGSRYKGIKLQLRQLPSHTLGLTPPPNRQSGGAMVARFQTSPCAPLPAPAAARTLS